MAKPQTTTAFTKAYNALNPAQKQAVDTIEGPVMVVAGPGTGKTQILTLRIANILLTTDTPPDAILALTFTEAGVYAMRSRLFSMIGAVAYKVRIHTFHSFCNLLIQEYPSYFKRLVGAEPLGEIDKILIGREIIDSHTWEHLVSFSDKYMFVQDILRMVSTLKRELVSPDELSMRITKEQEQLKTDVESYHTKGAHKGEMKSAVQKTLDKLERTTELARAYETYEILLKKHKTYDYDDMILEVLGAFSSNPDFLRIIQEECLYILADEHQDANTTQNTLISMLASYYDNPNLFLVGDEKQAIYSFQGASLEHFSGFKKIYPLAQVITLIDSYRSGEKILKVSRALMHAGGVAEARNPVLQSRHPEPQHATVSIHPFSSEEYELAWVTNAIQKQIAEGVDPKEIAVLYRNNRDVEALTREFLRVGIPHLVESNQNALADHRIQQLLACMRAGADNHTERSMSDALHAPWSGVQDADIHRILRASRVTHLPLIEVLSASKKIEGLVDRDAVERFTTSMKKAAQLSREAHARDFFSYMIRDTGFLKYVLSHSSTADTLARVRGLLATLEARAKKKLGYSAREFLQDIALYEEYKLQVEKDMPMPTTLESVRLMTAHGSKGLEFSYVYIIHAKDKKWGNTRGKTPFYVPRLESVGDDDERRLMYVALTRAKDGAYISYARSNAEGSSTLPSVFLADIETHVETVDMSSFEVAYQPEHVFTAPLPNPTEEDATFLRSLFVDQGLSVTALNNYLLCPWRYFYRNLVRIPDVQNKYLQFGNGMHDGVRAFFDEYAQKEKCPPVSVLLKNVETALKSQGFDTEGFTEAHAKAEECLPGWYAERKITWTERFQSELPIEVFMPLSNAPIARVLLRGKIDRLDTLANGSLRVLDYKTGTPKTRNELQGLTKNGTGDYYRQLAFYKLFIQLTERGVLKEAVIDFFEPGSNGKYRYEAFEISDEDVRSLQELIAKTAGEIYGLTFWDTFCDDAECEYCALRRGLSV